jgi:DNA-binding transcriptional regulator YdaS (Cro superfamily)
MTLLKFRGIQVGRSGLLKTVKTVDKSGKMVTIFSGERASFENKIDEGTIQCLKNLVPDVDWTIKKKKKEDQNSRKVEEKDKRKEFKKKKIEDQGLRKDLESDDIDYEDGCLFSSVDEDALVNCISADCCMSAGIAKKFESRYSDKSELMEKGERLIGEVIFTSGKSGKNRIYLVTKKTKI